MPDFLPRRDDKLLSWSVNFDRKINSDPEAYALTAQQAADYRILHVAYAELFQAANQRSARTPSGIVAKDAARDAMKDMARLLAGVVRSMPQVSDQQRAELGLRPRRVHRRSPLQPPKVAPLLRVVSRMGTTVTIELRDPDSPMRIAKPRGAWFAMIRTFVGEHPPVTLQSWRLHAQISVTNCDVNFPPALPPGTRVWITANWCSPTGKNGQACAPVGTWLAGGEMTAAA